jgi:hypothetical protein
LCVYAFLTNSTVFTLLEGVWALIALFFIYEFHAEKKLKHRCFFFVLKELVFPGLLASHHTLIVYRGVDKPLSFDRPQASTTIPSSSICPFFSFHAVCLNDNLFFLLFRRMA